MIARARTDNPKLVLAGSAATLKGSATPERKGAQAIRDRRRAPRRRAPVLDAPSRHASRRPQSQNAPLSCSRRSRQALMCRAVDGAIREGGMMPCDRYGLITTFFRFSVQKDEPWQWVVGVSPWARFPSSNPHHVQDHAPPSVLEAPSCDLDDGHSANLSVRLYCRIQYSHRFGVRYIGHGKPGQRRKPERRRRLRWQLGCLSRGRFRFWKLEQRRRKQ